MLNTTNLLVANIIAINDISSATDISKNTGNVAFDSTVAQFTSNLALAVGPNSIIFPVNIITQLYIKNIDPVKSILVDWALIGNPHGSVMELNPSDQIIFWCNPGGRVASGISQLTLTPSAVGCLVEYFLGG